VNDSVSTDIPQLSGNQRPLVSVVLLHYNRPHLLEEALASLLSQSYENLQITIVDNPSPASVQVRSIASDHPNVRVIWNPENLGYTGGMNRGIEQAEGDYIFLTEDDIVLEQDCVERLVEYMEADPTADLIAPLMYNKTAGTIRCAGGGFELGAVYRFEIYGAGENDGEQFRQPFDVSYIGGAAMFARRDFWQSYKGFREEYFMYGEDIELCARVMKRHQRMTVVPQAKVHQFEPEEKLVSSDIEFHKIKNFFSLYLLHAPARVLPMFVLRYALLDSVRTLLGRKDVAPRTFFRGLWWTLCKSPALLKERFTRSRDSAKSSASSAREVVSSAPVPLRADSSRR
jgi:GT2 family glycosyltransferase